MELTAMWDLFVTGILRGGMYALMAVGLSLVFGVMNIPNFAHGEFYMLGAYVAYIVHRTWDLPSLLATIMPLSLASVVAPVLAILAAGLFGFVLGLLVEKGVFYPLRIKAKEGWIINTFLLTVGLSFVVQNVALSIWGAKHRGIPGYWKGSLNLGGRMNIPTDRLVAFLLAVLIIGVFWFFMRRTRTGRAIRAVSQDERGAELVGINLNSIQTLTFALSCMLAGIAGASLLSITPANPTTGLNPLYKSWYVVILAGLGNVAGAIAGGFIVGMIESVAYYQWGADWQNVISLAILIVLLLVKPTGLFGSEVKGIWER